MSWSQVSARAPGCLPDFCQLFLCPCVLCGLHQRKSKMPCHLFYFFSIEDWIQGFVHCRLSITRCTALSILLCVWVCKPVGIVPQKPPTLLREGFLLAWSSRPVSLGWLAILPQGSLLSLFSQHWDYRSALLCVAFFFFLPHGVWSRSLCLCGKYFINWAISPAPSHK